MNFVKSIVATLAIAATSLASIAHATVIDFNHLAGTAIAGASGVNSQDTYFDSSIPLTTNGFTFISTNRAYLLGTAYSPSDSSKTAYNGTDYYLSGATFTISSAAASPFKVNSLDLASWTDGDNVTQATLTGTKVNGASVTQVITLSTISNAFNQTGNDFITYTLIGFEDLTSLKITPNTSNYFAMDNLHVTSTSVPEPSSLTLFGLALAGCVAMRRSARNAA